MNLTRVALITVTALVTSGLAAYAWSRLHPFVIDEEVTIEASADEVWAVLADQPSYADWNPSIISSEGELRPGARLRNTVRSGDGSMTFEPEVLVAEPGRELRWLGHMYVPGLADGEHSFVIEPLDDGRVRLTQREEFTGVLVPFAGGYLEPFRAEFRGSNDALAREVERRRAVASAR